MKKANIAIDSNCVTRTMSYGIKLNEENTKMIMMKKERW